MTTFTRFHSKTLDAPPRTDSSAPCTSRFRTSIEARARRSKTSSTVAIGTAMTERAVVTSTSRCAIRSRQIDVAGEVRHPTVAPFGDIENSYDRAIGRAIPDDDAAAAADGGDCEPDRMSTHAGARFAQERRPRQAERADFD